MDNPKRARSGKARKQPRECAYVRSPDLRNALERIRQVACRDKGARFTKKVNWILDADIRGFFDAIDHGWLMKVVEHRTLHPYPEQRLRVMT